MTHTENSARPILFAPPIDSTRTNGQPIDDPSIHQLALLGAVESGSQLQGNCLQKLSSLLASDLDFHGYDTSYATHDFHAFPAKFPPQLPRKFIRHLTNPGNIVLDPMMGSGTTIVEAYLANRAAIGFDIDPLAIRIARTKTTALDANSVAEMSRRVLTNAAKAVETEREQLLACLQQCWDPETKAFVDYWFALDTQIELLALRREIDQIADQDVKTFFELAFSAVIITKSGGVSLAFDLAHTRPHRAKVVYDQAGKLLFGEEHQVNQTPRTQFLTKKLRSALNEFQKRLQQNTHSLIELQVETIAPRLEQGDAQNMALETESVDLIVTSPPYASNAIDYMRAHKFSLVWLGYPVDALSETRKNCIGGENTAEFAYEKLPPYTQNVVNEIAQLDPKKGRVLHRYYSEMTRVLKEMYRVLKHDSAGVLVVGTSIMRNRDTETHLCLAEIGRTLGFVTPAIGVRHLDRNRRMMPAGTKVDRSSQIQQRMHEEYVIGFYKP